MDLKIRNLAKTYPNGVVALDDVSLDIPTGMFGLLGPNGAGKSTLMRTLATLQQADHGAASLGDIDILTEKNRIKPLLGYGALRIVEVPHIKSFGSIAFSLPTVFSWTESAGFLYDIEASNNFDFVFSTSAHEMAHQWWAHYVMPAHVEGIGLMGEHKQDYLYYSKGVLAMYTLKEYNGEEAINTALRHIVNEFGHQGKRKVTSLDLVAALRKVPEQAGSMDGDAKDC